MMYGSTGMYDDLVPRHQWRLIGHSLRGASHVRAGKPNQDSIGWYPASGCGPPLLLALSDGHGSAKYFRSHEGARIAVESATAVLQEFAAHLSGRETPAQLKEIAETTLPRLLVDRWRDTIAAHLAAQPFSLDELQSLTREAGEAATRLVETTPVLAYGATLLAVLVTEAFSLCFALGDGDVLAVFDSGETVRPFPRDPRLFANETTSLCSPEAWRDMQVSFALFHRVRPALILVSTDGYANSFRTEEEFLKIGPDYLSTLQSAGIEPVKEHLPRWLAEASRAGSGDDITIGIICRDDVLQTASPPGDWGDQAALDVRADATSSTSPSDTALPPTQITAPLPDAGPRAT
jgi:hypothetical protein